MISSHSNASCATGKTGLIGSKEVLTFLGRSVATAALTLVVGAAQAEPIELEKQLITKIVPKDGVPIVTNASEGLGAVLTRFDFHPVGGDSTVLGKQFKPANKVNPASVTHTYKEKEVHGTTGSATHTLKISDTTVKVDNKDVTVKVITDFAKSTIAPGKGEGKVSVQGSLFDPFVFSDTSLQAMAGYKSSGLNLPIGLSAGTAFPAIWADPSDPSSFGADASLTYIRLEGRVAPGVVSDPDLFWNSTPPGAVDLFTLTLVSDTSYNITATLTPGASTSDFVLDFTNFASAPGVISAAFAGNHGNLLSDLDDVFAAGFVPSASLTEYTVGVRSTTSLGANEVEAPEPSTLILLGIGLAGLRARGYRIS